MKFANAYAMGHFTVAGSLVTIEMSVGLMGTALGWVLQTGMAAWLMIITKRPFKIGDRIIDVSDITLTHVHLKEFGGTVGGEESSGREILIPTSRCESKIQYNSF